MCAPHQALCACEKTGHPGQPAGHLGLLDLGLSSIFPVWPGLTWLFMYKTEGKTLTQSQALALILGCLSPISGTTSSDYTL